ncbi:MAG: gamma-glutamyltransferase [Mariprofundus sp.]
MSINNSITGRNRGIVAAGHPATAEAGAAILRTGGNAVDAAIAAITTSFIAEPVLTSAGGGGFMLIADAKNKPRLYDGFARMPSGSMPTGMKAALKSVPINFGDHTQTFHIGQGSVATPSLMAMLFAAHRQHGRLPLAEAMAPGIDAARNGIRLNELQASFIELLRPILTDTKESTALHAPQGELLTSGQPFHNRDLANTLEMLLIEGIDEMYHGDLAKAVVSVCLPYGLLSMDDMRSQHVHIRPPLSVPLFSGTLLTNPPPSSGGLLIAYAATLLERCAGRAETTVLLAECLRAASLLRREHFDARIYDDHIARQILDPEHLQQAVSSMQERLHGHPLQHADEASNRHGSTTHISIVDGDGMAVSVTTSNGEGSGIVVPGSGIHLNNMLGEDDINPLGLHALKAGATLSSMMAPSIYMQNGRPSLVLGSGGSNRLRGAILQVLCKHLQNGQHIETAVLAPRLHNEGKTLDAEPGCLNEEIRHQLINSGWSINDWRQQSLYFGGVHAISVDQRGHIQAAGDPRRGGAVAYP